MRIYGTATPGALETIDGLVEALPYWEGVTVRSEDDPADFQLRPADPPVLSVVAPLGGYIDSAVIESGDYRVSTRLAPTVGVRRVIDAIESTYPGAGMLRRRQITRTRDDPKPVRRRLVADLTDRQRSTLEAAYHAGFFERPRDTSGEGVADSLGAAPPTFHRHLRKAQKKVFESDFSSASSDAGYSSD